MYLFIASSLKIFDQIRKNGFVSKEYKNTSMVSWFPKSFLLIYYTTTLSQATLSFPDTLLSLYSVLTLSKINTHFVMPFLLFQLSHLAFPFRSSMPGRAVLQSPSEAWVAMVTIRMMIKVNGNQDGKQGSSSSMLCLKPACRARTPPWGRRWWVFGWSP